MGSCSIAFCTASLLLFDSRIVSGVAVSTGSYDGPFVLFERNRQLSSQAGLRSQKSVPQYLKYPGFEVRPALK